ncbi:unnamed protein product, partial [Brachionus calyciflorus]
RRKLRNIIFKCWMVYLKIDENMSKKKFSQLVKVQKFRLTRELEENFDTF